MWQWDEIQGVTRPVDDANPIESPLDWSGTLYSWLDGEPTKNSSGWQTDHVIDLPDGTRIVIESDERAHTSVLITQRQEGAT